LLERDNWWQDETHHEVSGTSQVGEEKKGTMSEGSREEEESDEKEIAYHG